MKNYTKKVCLWEGVISDYIQHVKRNHKELFFKLEKNKFSLFKCYLSPKYNQIYEGVIFCDGVYFIFSIFYSANDYLHFSLFNLSEDVQINNKYALAISDKSEIYEFTCKLNCNLNCLDKSVNEHENKISIPQEILTKWSGIYNELQWKIRIIV